MSRLTILDDRVDARPAETAPAETAPADESGPALAGAETDAVSDAATTPEIESVRERLAGSTGRRYWRSLEQLADTPGFRAMLEREFPRFAAEWTGDLDRRRFLQLSSASLALAGLAGCTRQPYEEIVPYVRQPEQVIPGRPLFFATGIDRGGYAVPVLAESHLGRPTKLDGNPDSPVTKGKSDVFTQATILDLYDPDRAQAVRNLGTIRTWKAFSDTIVNKLTALRALEGEGLRILTGNVTSPTVKAMMDELLTSMPKARWHRYDTLGRDQVHQGSRLAFGQAHDPVYDLSSADVVVAVDSDFLTLGPGAVGYARDFGARRKPDSDGGMNRLYSVDTAPVATSTSADHRLAAKPSDVAGFVLALASDLGIGGATAPSAWRDGERAAFVHAVAADLRSAAGRSLVVAGDHLPAEAQAIVHAMNDTLGNVGTTVNYRPLDSDINEGVAIDQDADLADLVEDMRGGNVDALLILDANPVYSAPTDLDFAGALATVPLTASFGTRVDETARYCQWTLPESHDLERWGDGMAVDGSIVISQPLIEPLYDTRSPIELLAILLGKTTVPVIDLLRAQHAELDDRAWRRAVHDGFLPAPPTVAALPSIDGAGIARAVSTLDGLSADGFELAFRLDPSTLDGRYANNGWLQECPKPLTKLTWDNALLVSPRTFRDELGLGEPFQYGDQSKYAPVVRVGVGDHTIEVPVWALPGHADGAGTLAIGYGRTEVGRVGDGVGVDINPLRAAGARWQVLSGVRTSSTGNTYLLASTQDHHSMEGRELVRMASIDAYTHDPEHALAPHHELDTSKSILDRSAEWEYDTYAWGMTIDLSACTGCNACLVACQAENNIPTVGKDQVSRGREMHWIRVDRYFTGEDGDSVEAIVNQPVPCMQCEQAPCEVVCPVAATVHSDEGLNDMVYNRCVGTRYCSNNCPYKVRRFNFLLYSDFETPQLQLGRNPNVTIRSRGVMEKCSYCVQRINSARIDAKRDNRPIREGEVVTACQSACPSDAIVFGDLNDEQSAVAKNRASARNYNLLDELGTRPRTTYMARITNPNPALEKASSHDAGGHGQEEAHG